MSRNLFPANLGTLHENEEALRGVALSLVAQDDRLTISILAVESAMDVADKLRQFPTVDDDLKTIQILGMRIFNAFGSSLKLTLSGYNQNATMILRDVLETVFLLDLFRGNPRIIAHWRLSDKAARLRGYGPVKVRMALDQRDGHTEKKRALAYDTFSELAGHPNASSHLMLRPTKDADAEIGPFIEETSLTAVLSEMGKLAVQAGEVLDEFFPEGWSDSLQERSNFARLKQAWLAKFYPVAGR